MCGGPHEANRVFQRGKQSVMKAMTDGVWRMNRPTDGRQVNPSRFNLTRWELSLLSDCVPILAELNILN